VPLRRRFRALPVVVALVLLVAGCATGAPAAPAPRQGGVAPRPAGAGLGDLRTIDPCTLVDPAALAGFGEVSPTDTVSLDYCLLHLQMPRGALVQVAFGQLDRVDPNHPRPGQPVVRRSGLSIIQDAPLPDHCSREVVMADGLTLRVNADLLSGQSGPGLCGIAESAAQAVAGTVEQHRVGHRSFPPNSLAWADPCAALDPATVQSIPGLEEAGPNAEPARHQCEWGVQEADSSRVRFVHTAGAPPAVQHGAAVEEEIAGRRTVISMVGRDPRVPLCSAETAHIPFGDPAWRQTEVAMLVVAVPGTNGIGACEFARGLAEQAWPKLPKS
jgi:hypothetical protein